MSWEQESKTATYEFKGDLIIKRNVFEHISLNDVSKIVTGVFKQVEEQGGLDTDTLSFNNGKLRVIVKDSHSKEEITEGEGLSKSGDWHRKAKYSTLVSIEETE